jgi:hypothetical protein
MKLKHVGVINRVSCVSHHTVDKAQCGHYSRGLAMLVPFMVAVAVGELLHDDLMFDPGA